MIIEVNKKKDKTGRRAFTAVLHEIYPDETLIDKTGTVYNRNGISWIRRYVEPNLDSIHGMSLTVEFLNEERSQIYGHGETDLVGGDDGLPLFENATVVGYFEKGWIDTVKVNGEMKTAVIANGFIDEMRYPKFVKWLTERVSNGGTVFGSIEFFKKEGNDNIIYLDGYKEKGRVPVEYMYSGFALLDITPADNTATLLEINKFIKNNEEENAMDEKTLSLIVDSVKAVVVETNSKNAEYEAKIAELNATIEAKDAEIAEINKKKCEAETDACKKKEEMCELNATIEAVTAELNEMKKTIKITELNSALEGYSESEKEYAKAEIEKYMADPVSCGIEINAITTIIKANSYDAIKAKEAEEKKNAEINSAQDDVKIDAIFGAVDDDTKTSDTLDFGSMFC